MNSTILYARVLIFLTLSSKYACECDWCSILWRCILLRPYSSVARHLKKTLDTGPGLGRTLCVGKHRLIYARPPDDHSPRSIESRRTSHACSFLELIHFTLFFGGETLSYAAVTSLEAKPAILVAEVLGRAVVVGVVVVLAAVVLVVHVLGALLGLVLGALLVDPVGALALHEAVDLGAGEAREELLGELVGDGLACGSC